MAGRRERRFRNAVAAPFVCRPPAGAVAGAYAKRSPRHGFCEPVPMRCAGGRTAGRVRKCYAGGLEATPRHGTFRRVTCSEVHADGCRHLLAECLQRIATWTGVWDTRRPRRRRMMGPGGGGGYRGMSDVVGAVSGGVHCFRQLSVAQWEGTCGFKATFAHAVVVRHCASHAMAGGGAAAGLSGPLATGPREATVPTFHHGAERAHAKSAPNGTIATWLPFPNARDAEAVGRLPLSYTVAPRRATRAFGLLVGSFGEGW